MVLLNFKNWLLAFIAGLLLSFLIMAGTLYYVLISGSINPGADQSTPAIERWAAKTSIRAFLKSHTPNSKNPLEINDANLTSGCKLYVNNCAVCHGLADGKKTKVAEGFYKSAPLFANEDWSKDNDGLLYWFIEHGVRLTAMPAYNLSLNEKEKWQIVMFVKNMRLLPVPVDHEWKSVRSIEVMK